MSGEQPLGKGEFQGSPRRFMKERRPHRVVTFVTDRQLDGLRQISQEEGRSLSDVLHRMIAEYLKHNGLRNTR